MLFSDPTLAFRIQGPARHWHLRPIRVVRLLKTPQTSRFSSSLLLTYPGCWKGVGDRGIVTEDKQVPFHVFSKSRLHSMSLPEYFSELNIITRRPKSKLTAFTSSQTPQRSLNPCHSDLDCRRGRIISPIPFHQSCAPTRQLRILTPTVPVIELSTCNFIAARSKSTDMP